MDQHSKMLKELENYKEHLSPECCCLLDNWNENIQPLVDKMKKQADKTNEELIKKKSKIQINVYALIGIIATSVLLGNAIFESISSNKR